ncbi:MAG: hypothetical protein K1X57_07565 [Gemmataceae bacterium]|nr:hypothetical protein [Gemmataceae bacterium]
MATTLHNSTRQQLDELDTLLQKMLDGPGKPSNDPPAPVFPSGRTAEVPKFDLPKLAQIPDPVSAPEPASSPARWDIDLNPKSGSSVLGDRSPLAEKLAAGHFDDAPEVAVAPAPAPKLNFEPVPAVAPFSVTDTAAVPVPFWSRPAVRINHAFDAWASSWGFLGRVAVSSFGRTLLGYAGLLMLCYSVYWLTSSWATWSASVGGLR